MRDQLLIESLTSEEGNIITESFVNNKDVFLQGIFMQAEQRNRNGRVYQLSEMVTAVNNVNEHIKQYGGLFGELDHPADRLSVSMDRISHIITELRMDGNNVVGKAKLLNTPMGQIAKEIASVGRYGVSSRGAGQVNEQGIVSGFRLVTIDLVVTPSAHGAMPSTIYESLQDYKRGGEIMSLAEAVRNDPDAQKYLTSEIHKFISSLSKK